MQQKVIIRSGGDRIRYTCLFEIFLILILAPLGAIVFDRALTDIGLLSLVLSTKAMLLNLVYNWFFDLADARAGRLSSQRSFIGRITHALGFELSLLTTSIPIVVWWLGLSWIDAILMDLVITSFVVLYTLVFTWGYDQLFPLVSPSVNESSA